MNRVDLKEHVRQAMNVEWEAFAAAHPRLAEVIDTELLLEQATASLSDDPEFIDAMDRAAAAGIGAEALQSALHNLLKEWLAKLL